MRKVYILFFLLAVVFMTGCQSYKKVPYLQNSNEVDLSLAAKLYDARIMPKDILNITVNSPNNPIATAIFNLTVQMNDQTISSSERSRVASQEFLQQYLVTNDGYIDFPILGKIKVLGMTKTELENYITEHIYGTHLKERPIVTVIMSNFKISVLGEVTKAGQYNVSTGKINIFEALALAGDMTIQGKRDNVKIIRELCTGEKEIVELNLNDANIINSPYYQLQQNDIVYVTPNKAKSKGSGVGAETSLWFTSTSIVISIASLLYNMLR